MSCDTEDCLSCVASLLQLIISTLTDEEGRVRIVSEVNDNAPPRIFFLGGKGFDTDTFYECVEGAIGVIDKCGCDSGCFDCIKSKYESISEKSHVVIVLEYLRRIKIVDIADLISQDIGEAFCIISSQDLSL